MRKHLPRARLVGVSRRTRKSKCSRENHVQQSTIHARTIPLLAGQKLGRDFRDQLAREAQLRWWHNRALHKSFGVSHGFAVSAVIDAGEFVAVSVTCGVAYDCFGRELTLPDNSGLTYLPRYRKRIKRHLVASYKRAVAVAANVFRLCLSN